MPPAIGEEFHRKKQQIRDFCKRATNSGGVLLVTGTRGVGKTRLVDEALNERDKIDACRYETPRLPRDVKRFIIRVDVDPNFPNPKPEANSTDDAPPDENTLAFILIRNIIFALTSTIDSRFSLRKHGKTLYARLGFWNYWFAPNGLMPGVFKGWCWLILTAIFMSLTCLLHHGLILKWLYMFTLGTLGAFAMPLSLGDAACLSLISLVLAWLLLRWLDLRAFAFISADLYDLAHAQEKTKNHSDNREDKSEMTSKLPWLLVGIVLICVVVNPEWASPLTDLMPQEQTTTSVADTPSNPEQSDKNAKQTQGDHHETSPHEDHLTRVQAFILTASLLITFLVTRTHSHNNQDRADFGIDNPVWMITLLRRYLYTCHRCGIEPVLVLDELDKLEDIEYWVKHKGQDTEKPGLTKLGMFLMALARLKSSLGAEFLWVLVSGSRLYSYLQEDRHDCKNGALGLLATVIHQDIILGPSDYKSAEDYFNGLNQNLAEPYKKYLWLRSRGNFATMIRNHEAYKNLSSTPFVNNLADAVIGIWNPDTQLGFLKNSPTRLVKQQLHAEWVQIWIHAGILEIANRLTKQQFNYSYFSETLPQAVKDKYGDSQGELEELEITALFSEQPELLTLLGERLFFAYLNRCEFLNDPHSDLNLGSILSFKPSFYR
ncbi:MAG: ATP-binding protein [Methylococcaceae bacterium]|nr:ATP-binding protein [Methylococcaceae bacterium]